ncbi:MAG: BtpA/SgcQ family protein [Pyrinomonadaceae bacterium]|nr:BtpA/SgcQ family protein [Pyrinomonadaceae bacterium]
MSNALFIKEKPVIGVIHVGALPGTPAGTGSVYEIIEHARAEARVYLSGGVDGLMIENMHDVPYLRGRVGPEIVAAMAVIALSVKEECSLPTGIQILAGANMEAMAVAHAAGLDLIRAEGYVFAHIADEGWIESSAAELLRYRKQIGADRVEVWADVKKKHSSHAVTTDITLGETAEAVEFMRGNAVIVTGSVTGRPPRLEDVGKVRAHCRLPVILGSGVDLSNIAEFYRVADGFIIGSYFKKDGHWANTVDRERVERLMEAVNRLRG